MVSETATDQYWTLYPELLNICKVCGETDSNRINILTFARN